jgi:hypothetical protein
MVTIYNREQKWRQGQCSNDRSKSFGTNLKPQDRQGFFATVRMYRMDRKDIVVTLLDLAATRGIVEIGAELSGLAS